MQVYNLHREQWIQRPREEVFSFFSDAGNLDLITPAWLSFRMLTPTPIEMAVGTKLDYRLRWHGVPLRWTTEIIEWDPPNGFVDIQLKGPYRLWHHTHRFLPEAGGTRIVDHVRYAVPFGIAGRLLHGLSIRRDVEAIFDYRAERSHALFESGLLQGRAQAT
jgi:ligand-binding SRPBCC domain-containing protein